MALSEQRKGYLYEYQKAKLKRIPLDVPKEKYDQIKTAAETTGESVNGYIKKAIDERMERDTETPTEATAQPQTATTTLLPPDILEEAQNAAERTGEAVPEFVIRAVKTQVKRDETTRRMGLDPITGGKLQPRI